ncbi:MAG: ABC transporter permease [Actinomycetota bacterium]|nr:ABC transporter permease [Actinomycetota bacterium]
MSTATPAPVAGAGARRDPAAPSLTALAVLRTRIELKQFFRERDAVIFIFAFPVIMLAIFGSVFDEDVGGGVSFTQYFVPGIVAAGIMLSSFQSLAIGIAIERDDGTLKRLRGTPMPPAAYFLGKIGMVLVSSVLQTGVLLTAAALVFNIDLPTSPSRWVTFAWVFVLGTSAGTVLGIAFSSVPRSGRSASAVVTPIVIVLQFISGVFFVYDDLPAWMRNIAELFPLKWMAQGMRSVFLPDSYQSIEADGSWQLGLGAVVLGVWLVVGLAACLWTFRWSRRDAG